MDRFLVRPLDQLHPASPSVVALVRAGVVDAELAALLWLLLDGRVPLVAAGRGDTQERRAFLGALLELLPPDVALRPSDDLDIDVEDPRTTYLVVDELLPGDPSTDDVRRGRAAVRSLQRGFGLGATVAADSLEDVFAVLQAPPLALGEDEIRALGVVLVLDAGPRPRVVAAHYLRPVERDMHGHLQRRPPVVLATWDPAAGIFEHFAWGVTPELALRVGRTQADFEDRQAGRARFLGELASDASARPVARALVDFRSSEERPAAALHARPAHDHRTH